MMTGMEKGLDSSYNWNPLLLLAAVLISAFMMLIYLSPLRDLSIPSGEYALLERAEALPLDVGMNDLPLHDAEWEPVTFPLHWRNHFPRAVSVWYRLQISASALNDLAGTSFPSDIQPLGLYLWRLNQTADFWFNGSKIGSGDNTGETMERNWNSPLFFTIPASLIESNNEILIRHYALHSWGSMESILLGPEDALKPVYEARYFMQHEIPSALFVFVLITGLFSFFVWFYRQQEAQYLWFTIASAGMSFYCLNQFIRYLPFDSDLWRWLSNITTDLWAGAIFVFLLRSLRLERPRAEKLVYAYLLSGIPVYFYASFFQVFDINIYYHAGSLLLGMYGLSLCVQEYRETRKLLPAFYSSIITVLFMVGLHDMIMQGVLNNGLQNGSQTSFQNQFNSVHLAAPLVFLFIAASLIKQFVSSMNAADRLNAELEARVSEARQELADNYRSIEQVLVRESASRERERIFRDLHDDVGSKLLSLYYRLDKESDSTLAKSALEDLRDIVSHKALGSISLRDAVQQWRQEVSERLRDADVALSWQCDIGDQNFELSEMQQTQLRRMFREVISNALLHSREISEISLQIIAQKGTLSVRIANDGAATPVRQWKIGRGISNLRVRSRELHGNFAIQDLAGGWVEAAWDVPLNVG